MARRSATNPRYQKDAKIGSTRRSASSLRAKRPGASSAGGKKARGKGGRARGRPRFERPAYMRTPEWRLYSRYNWVAIGIAIAAALVMTVPQYVGPLAFLRTNRLLFSIMAGTWLGGLGTSLYIQFVVLRRLRKAAEDKGGKAQGKKGPGKGGKDS